MTGRGGAALGLVVALACSPAPASRRAGAPAPAGTAAQPADTTVVALERTPCFGACPVYSLTISAGGVVRFVGTRHTAHLGDASARIPPAQVESLLAELREGGYFGFADAYVLDAPACGLYSTDSPTVITAVSDAGERKEIRHDYGCAGAPGALARLEQRIDEVAGSARWTGR
ncbi:MAG TPA: DUF6438 domain-containing protein [Gemmatimonadales bacterium]|nr:DUF6438 domain-containing protein [Gemmatimonadales bacterium]